MRKLTFRVLTGACAAMLLVASCKKEDSDPVTPTPTTPTPTPSLYTRLGGNDGIVAVTDQMIANVLADPLIADNFSATGSDPYRFNLFRERLIDFMAAGTGGPVIYRGENMFDAHDGMNITSDEFDHLVTALVASMNQFNVPAQEQGEVAAILLPMKNDIINH